MTDSTKSLITVFALIMKNQEYHKIPDTLEKLLPDAQITLNLFNSIVSGLSNMNEGLSKKQANSFLKILNKKLDSSLYNETSYTALIKLYSNEVFNKADKVVELFDTMKSLGIKIKRRTMAPVLQMCKREELYELAMTLYLDCKIHDIKLEEDDYLAILTLACLEEPMEIYNIKMIIADMVKNIETISHNGIAILEQLFPNNRPIEINSDGTCDEVKLPGVSFTSSEKTNMLTRIETYVGNMVARSSKHHGLFGAFIKKIKGYKYDIVIDSANVGFYKQGTNSGKIVNLGQLIKFIDHLNSKKYRIMLILHSRHTQSLDKSRQAELEYIKKNVAYHIFTPHGMDDDWYWLYSVMSKNKCKVLTNDELRNHLFYMNLGDMFMDWKKYCIINYSTDLKGNPILDIPDQYMTKIYFSYKDNKMVVPIKKGGWHYFSLTFDDK